MIVLRLFTSEESHFYSVTYVNFGNWQMELLKLNEVEPMVLRTPANPRRMLTWRYFDLLDLESVDWACEVLMLHCSPTPLLALTPGRVRVIGYLPSFSFWDGGDEVADRRRPSRGIVPPAVPIEDGDPRGGPAVPTDYDDVDAQLKVLSPRQCWFECAEACEKSPAELPTIETTLRLRLGT